MIRILHLADLHLDTPFRGLSATAPEVAAILRDASLQALERAADWALREKRGKGLDAVTFGGDIFDQDSPSLRARRHFLETLRRLHGAGIRCFVVSGNHDPLEQEELWGGQAALQKVAVIFDRRWRTVFLEQDGKRVCALSGRGYSRASDNANPLEGFGPALEEARRAPVRLGLLHADVGPRRTEPSGYAAIEAAALHQAGLDAWLLGHIHKRREFRERALLLYPGNLQGRDINEEGPKGGVLVEISGGRVTTTDVPFAPILWKRIEIPVDGAAGDEDLADAVLGELQALCGNAGTRGVISRVTLTGRARTLQLWRKIGMPAGLAELSDALRPAQRQPFVLVERIESRVQQPLDRAKLLARDDLLGDFLRLVDDARRDPDSEAARYAREAVSKLEEHRACREYGELSTLAGDFEALLDHAEKLALAHFLPDGEGEEAQ